MTTVTEDLDLPSGVDPTGVVVTVYLAGTNGDALPEGYNQTTGKTIVGSYRFNPAADGTWQLDLDGNADLIPAGTVWARTVSIAQPGGSPYATVPAAGGPYRWDEILADPPGSLETPASTALLNREQRAYRWLSWDDWTELPMSSPGDNTPVLTVDGAGGGTISGGDPSVGGNDRRVWRLDNGETYSDLEAFLTYELSSAAAQAGLALRIDTPGGGEQSAAIGVFNSVVFGASYVTLVGFMRWDEGGGNFSLEGNLTGPIGGSVPLREVSGNGTTSTARTLRPHPWQVGQQVNITGLTGYGTETLATVPGIDSFTFSDPASGTQSGGRAVRVGQIERKTLGVRLIGSTFVVKVWLTELEPKPSWNDPVRAATYTLPATFSTGRAVPTSGEVGVVGNHFGGASLNRSATYVDLTVRRLNVVSGLSQQLQLT